MRQMDFERIRQSIFNVGELKVNLLVLPNRKAANGNLLTSSFIREYKSNKYPSELNLKELDINMNTYIQFEYIKFVDSNRISENVLASYPHIGELGNFMIDSLNHLSENYEAIYTENGINDQFNEYRVSNELVQRKQIGIAPIFVNTTNGNGVPLNLPGVLLFIKDENYTVELTLDQYQGMVDNVAAICNNFALRNFTNQTYIMAQLDYLIYNTNNGSNSGGSNQVFNNVNRTQTSFGGNKPAGGISGGKRLPRRTGKGLNQPTSTSVSMPEIEKPSVKRKVVTEKTTIDELADDVTSTDDLFDLEFENEINNAEAPVINKVDEEDSSMEDVSSNNPLLNSIMEEANNSDFELDI